MSLIVLLIVQIWRPYPKLYTLNPLLLLCVCIVSSCVSTGLIHSPALLKLFGQIYANHLGQSSANLWWLSQRPLSLFASPKHLNIPNAKRYAYTLSCKVSRHATWQKKHAEARSCEFLWAWAKGQHCATTSEYPYWPSSMLRLPVVTVLEA